jgi:hypothetical protein
LNPRITIINSSSAEIYSKGNAKLDYNHLQFPEQMVLISNSKSVKLATIQNNQKKIMHASGQNLVALKININQNDSLYNNSNPRPVSKKAVNALLITIFAPLLVLTITLLSLIALSPIMDLNSIGAFLIFTISMVSTMVFSIKKQRQALKETGPKKPKRGLFLLILASLIAFFYMVFLLFFIVLYFIFGVMGRGLF